MKKSYPNNVGDYAGKRQPKPDPKPRTAADRFHGLAALFACHARDYRRKRA